MTTIQVKGSKEGVSGNVPKGWNEKRYRQAGEPYHGFDVAPFKDSQPFLVRPLGDSTAEAAILHLRPCDLATFKLIYSVGAPHSLEITPHILNTNYDKTINERYDISLEGQGQGLLAGKLFIDTSNSQSFQLINPDEFYLTFLEENFRPRKGESPRFFVGPFSNQSVSEVHAQIGSLKLIFAGGQTNVTLISPAELDIAYFKGSEIIPPWKTNPRAQSTNWTSTIDLRTDIKLEGGLGQAELGTSNVQMIFKNSYFIDAQNPQTFTLFKNDTYYLKFLERKEPPSEGFVSDPPRYFVGPFDFETAVEVYHNLIDFTLTFFDGLTKITLGNPEGVENAVINRTSIVDPRGVANSNEMKHLTSPKDPVLTYDT